jgi:hypothetical protein
VSVVAPEDVRRGWAVFLDGTYRTNGTYVSAAKAVRPKMSLLAPKLLTAGTPTRSTFRFKQLQNRLSTIYALFRHRLGGRQARDRQCS